MSTADTEIYQSGLQHLGLRVSNSKVLSWGLLILTCKVIQSSFIKIIVHFWRKKVSQLSTYFILKCKQPLSLPLSCLISLGIKEGEEEGYNFQKIYPWLSLYGGIITIRRFFRKIKPVIKSPSIQHSFFIFQKIFLNTKVLLALIIRNSKGL